MRLRRVLTGSGLALACASLSVVLTAQTTATTIHACVQNPTGLVRIVSASEVCRPGESRVTWSSGGDSTSTTSSTPAPPSPPWPPVFPAGTLPAAGAHDLFLSVSGVNGDSIDERHKNWIEIGAATFGTWTVNAEGSAQAAPGLTDLMVLKYLDLSSYKLLQLSQTGQHLKEVIIEAVKAGADRQTFLEVRLEDVVISSFRHSAQSTTAIPTEEISFRPTGRIRFTYIPIDPKTGKPGAKVTSCWDVVRNQTC